MRPVYVPKVTRIFFFKKSRFFTWLTRSLSYFESFQRILNVLSVRANTTEKVYLKAPK